MIKISSINSLIEILLNHHENEWVYTNLSQWKKNPSKCDFFIISEKEIDNLPDNEVYESEAGPFLPISLQHLDLYPWMQIDTLKGVVSNLGINLDNDNFINGVEYYREYDDFLDSKK